MPTHRLARASAGVLTALGLLVLPAGCGMSASPGAAASGSSSGQSGGSITVLAAASLTEAFNQIAKDFQAKSSSTVTFSYGSSATLATQIIQGAPADVFAAASPATMKTVTDAGLAAASPTNFVSNTLEIAVPARNPGKVTGLKDFADAGKKIAICDPSVPCGTAAVKVFAAARITPRPDTLGTDVKATLQQVSSDEVDAALVYKTDVIAAGTKVQGIEFPEAHQAVNQYPIAALKASKNVATAQDFVDYVLSPEGQSVLAKSGFAKP